MRNLQPDLRRSRELTAVTSAASLPAAGSDEARILFAGDVLLSRQVEVEVSRSGRSPWTHVAEELGRADLVFGNLEGAVGSGAGCFTSSGPCFPIDTSRIALLKRAGFTAMTLENNHADDLGESGRDATLRSLRAEGIRPIDLEHGPSFFRAGDVTIAVVAINLVPGRGTKVTQVPSPEIRRQLRLASRLAHLVIVSIHWGEELIDWSSAQQRDAARWLIANGASVVMGHHPHVVQPPECIDGRPVYFSLGNHLFDQKYPETKRGLIADCRISGGIMECGGLETRTASGSFSPAIVEPRVNAAASLAGCRVPLASQLRLGDTTLRPAPSVDAGALVLEGVRNGDVAFRTRPIRMLSADAAAFAGSEKPALLFTLERHPSPIDGEAGVRPYVYEVGPRGLVARWRGSALAFPLVDATPLPGRPRILCALHRNDSFLALDPKATVDRVALYSWNGFGFSGERDPEAFEECRALWGLL